jgi:hypothetical protein
VVEKTCASHTEHIQKAGDGEDTSLYKDFAIRGDQKEENAKTTRTMAAIKNDIWSFLFKLEWDDFVTFLPEWLANSERETESHVRANSELE